MNCLIVITILKMIERFCRQITQNWEKWILIWQLLRRIFPTLCRVTRSIMEKKKDYWWSIWVVGLEITFCSFELTNLPKNKMTTNNVQWTFTACPFSSQAISLLRNESNWWTAFIQLVQKLQRLISLFSSITTHNMTGHIIFVTENKSSLSSLLPLLSVEHSLDEIGRKLDQVWILNLLYLTF